MFKKRSLVLFAAGAHFGQNGVDTVLVDGADSVSGNAQANPAVFTFNPETTGLQVWQEATLGLIVGVRNIVARHWAFSGHLAYACHGHTP